MPLALKDGAFGAGEAENAGAPIHRRRGTRPHAIGIARGYADLDWTALG